MARVNIFIDDTVLALVDEEAGVQSKSRSGLIQDVMRAYVAGEKRKRALSAIDRLAEDRANSKEKEKRKRCQKR